MVESQSLIKDSCRQCTLKIPVQLAASTSWEFFSLEIAELLLCMHRLAFHMLKAWFQHAPHKFSQEHKSRLPSGGGDPAATPGGGEAPTPATGGGAPTAIPAREDHMPRVAKTVGVASVKLLCKACFKKCT